MVSLISKAIVKVSSLLKKFQIKQFLSMALVALLMLAANIDSGFSPQSITDKLDEVVHQDDSVRPKTTGEWNQEARETEGAPGEKLKRIGKQSAEAVRDFASIYPDTAQKSVSELKNSSK